jgi:hypothetical protein
MNYILLMEIIEAFDELVDNFSNEGKLYSIGGFL